ncbi:MULTISPECIES: WD40 repeat domain-containing protein [Streptomyces]|uniref:WD40 repeat protein n=1 Tax=Streptomyces nymphaeiformis TaxID=2663842 RepID=A0A7W7TWP9_9ACTN|nr:WD40 repeat domain-containing protein [Streptomyces nymphaeiformis]MBB4980759.1 WD40 repeat protein [Streptomyces nymphaeiformis]
MNAYARTGMPDEGIGPGARGDRLRPGSTAVRSTNRAVGEITTPTELMVLRLTSDDAEIVGVDYIGYVRRWDRLLGQPLSDPVQVHARTVFAMVLTPDDREIVIGGGDGVLRRWDRVDGTPLGEPLIGHRLRVRGLAVTRDGRELVSASQDGTVRRWDRAAGSPLGEPLRGHAGTVRAVALGADEDVIVTAGQDGTVRRWNRSAGTPIGEPLLGHSGPIQALAAAPDGRIVASGGRDGTVRRWDLGSGRPVGPPLVLDSPVWSVLLTSDGEIAAGSAHGLLHRWDRTGQRIGAAVAAHTWGVPSLAVTRDESELVTCGWDRRIRRWARVTGEPTRSARKETRIELVPRLEITGTTPF